ncbi:methyl-accepting chemotaxis protein [Ferrimonas marina]|uniref:Methyl-accepting chemotaxis sensory transducer with Cache sensor n=1 Tax=Ferrimonas marina TaxID=299255 RepID=A0A1M5XY43_9GAMM|nr:methyl-accepting chemotaxis protein [Ferrimonas marina]SHI04173.1 methyl-accepting chemotaxis sensory transducer with Cache sensor [Ferrimonas marina]
MSLLSRLPIRRKLMLLSLMAALATLTLLGYAAWTTTQATRVAIDHDLENDLRLGASILVRYQSQQQELGQAAAQERALEVISGLRYDEGNFFWVMDSEGRLLSHPHWPALLGQDVRQQHLQGDHYWDRMLTLVAQQSEGFVRYNEQLPGELAQAKYAYVKAIPEWDWVIGTAIDAVDPLALAKEVLMQLVWVALAALLLTEVVNRTIRRDIVGPIAELEKVCERLAQGDLRERTSALTERGDELGHLAQALKQAQQRLAQLLGQVQQAVSQNESQAQRIAEACQSSQNEVNLQQQQLDQVACAMTQMRESVQQVAQQAEQTAEVTQRVSQRSAEGAGDMTQAATQIRQLTDTIECSSEQITALRQGVLAINEVTEVIDGLSDQTNLLALNAAIEAARAGDQGRGFAVVADEVRQLASHTQQSTSEVKQQVTRLQSDAATSVKMMSDSRQLALKGAESVEQLSEGLQEVVVQVQQANQRSGHIAAAAEEQRAVAAQVSDNLQRANDAGHNVSEQAERLAQRSQELRQSARHLSDQLAKFKL